MKRAWLILTLLTTVAPVLLVLAFLTTLTPLILRAQNPSLAEVARQERARQKSATSKAIFTNETLGIPVAPPAPPAPPVESKPAADKGDKGDKAASEKPAEKAAAVPTAESEWREKFARARADIQRLDDRVKVLQLELNQLRMDLLTRSDIYNREGQLAPLITSKEQELTSAQKEALGAHEKLTGLEQELRRSGDPIGWSR